MADELAKRWELMSSEERFAERARRKRDKLARKMQTENEEDRQEVSSISGAMETATCKETTEESASHHNESDEEDEIFSGSESGSNSSSSPSSSSRASSSLHSSSSASSLLSSASEGSTTSGGLASTSSSSATSSSSIPNNSGSESESESESESGSESGSQSDHDSEGSESGSESESEDESPRTSTSAEDDLDSEPESAINAQAQASPEPRGLGSDRVHKKSIRDPQEQEDEEGGHVVVLDVSGNQSEVGTLSSNELEASPTSEKNQQLGLKKASNEKEEVAPPLPPRRKVYELLIAEDYSAKDDSETSAPVQINFDEQATDHNDYTKTHATLETISVSDVSEEGSKEKLKGLGREDSASDNKPAANRTDGASHIAAESTGSDFASKSSSSIESDSSSESGSASESESESESGSGSESESASESTNSDSGSEFNSDSGSELGSGTGSDSDSDSGSELDSESDSESESEVEAGSSIVSKRQDTELVKLSQPRVSETRLAADEPSSTIPAASKAGPRAVLASASVSRSGSETPSGSGSYSGSELGSGSGSESESESASESGSQSDSESESESESQSGSNSESESESETDSESGSESEAESASPSSALSAQESGRVTVLENMDRETRQPALYKSATNPALVTVTIDEEAVREHALTLGMNPDTDRELLWIAKEALVAPLPAGWTQEISDDGQPYFYHASSGQSRWEHPRDDEFRAKIEDHKRQNERSKTSSTLSSMNASSSGSSPETESVEQQKLSGLVSRPHATGMYANKKPVVASMAMQRQRNHSLATGRLGNFHAAMGKSSFMSPLIHTTKKNDRLRDKGKVQEIVEEEEEEEKEMEDRKVTAIDRGVRDSGSLHNDASSTSCQETIGASHSSVSAAHVACAKESASQVVHAENWDYATLSKLEVLRQKCQDLEKQLENATKKTQDAEEQRIQVQVANEALEKKMAKQRSVPAIEKELEDERERAMRSEEEKRALEESIVQIRDQADAKVAASMQASAQANLQVSKTLDQLNNARMLHEAERLQWIAEKESLNSKLEDIHALREQVALAEKETKNLEEQLATERSKFTSLEQERNSLASSREAFEKDTKTRLEASWEGERENRHQVLEQAFEKRVRDLLLEKQNLVGELHDQTNLCKDRIASLEAENGKLKAQVQDQARQVREKETEKLSLQGRLDNSVSALREAQKDVRCLETAKRDMEQLGRDSAAQADLLAQKLAESSASIRALEAEREQLRVRNAQSQFLENSRDNDLGARNREMKEQGRASPGSRHHQHQRQQQQSADHHPQQTLERLQNQHERELQDAVTATAHRTSERWRQKMQELRASHREEMHKAQHLLELERERHQSALREYELKLSFVRQQARTECASAAADVERVSMLNEKLLAQAPRRQLQGVQQHHPFQYAPKFADSEIDLRDEDFGPASSDWAPPHQGNHRSPGPVAQLNMHIAVLRDQCRSACGPRPSPLRCQEDLENLFRTEENMSRLYLRSDAMQRSPSPIPFPKIL